MRGRRGGETLLRMDTRRHAGVRRVWLLGALTLITAVPVADSVPAHAAMPEPSAAPLPSGKTLRDQRPGFDWVSSAAGWTVWSKEFEGGYRLLARRGRTTRLLPAPASAVSQDPGAGLGPTGRPSAVYQRCTGAVCSIWLIDLVSGSQRRVARLGRIRRETGRASDEDFSFLETHPRLWGGRVAFKTGGSRVKRPRLRVGPSAAGNPGVRTLRTSPGEDGGQLQQIAVGLKHVVVFWEDDFCFGRCLGLYIHGMASGRQALIDDARGTGACIASLDGVRFDGRAFRWTRQLFANDGGRCPSKTARLRYDPATGRTTER